MSEGVVTLARHEIAARTRSAQQRRSPDLIEKGARSAHLTHNEGTFRCGTEDAAGVAAAGGQGVAGAGVRSCGWIRANASAPSGRNKAPLSRRFLSCPAAPDRLVGAASGELQRAHGGNG